MVVTPEDYILGMSDLTGELMRYATNGESRTGSGYLSAIAQLEWRWWPLPPGAMLPPCVLAQSRVGAMRSCGAAKHPRPPPSG